MKFLQYNIDRASYIDTDGNTWMIYKINEFVNGYPSINFYIQKEGYGIIELAFGFDGNDEPELYEASVVEYIERVKDEEKWN